MSTGYIQEMPHLSVRLVVSQWHRPIMEEWTNENEIIQKIAYHMSGEEVFAVTLMQPSHFVIASLDIFEVDIKRLNAIALVSSVLLCPSA
jgi:hypothetical protein